MDVRKLVDYVTRGQWFNTGYEAGVYLEHRRCGETVMDGMEHDDQLTVVQLLVAAEQHERVCHAV